MPRIVVLDYGSGNLRSAERDYDEAVRMLDALKEQGAIEGTDLQSLEQARTELARIREQIAP